MAFRLPPLNSLRIFEAAGRHISFKDAAEELHVTPSAVSHAVQTLEDWLGTKLFERTPRGLALTQAGRRYLPGVHDALAGLARATERIPGRRAAGSLSVSVAPTFASRWLVPRLSRFTERFPHIVVTIDTACRQVEPMRDGIDLMIRMAPKPSAAGLWLRLVRESLVPVCAPSLLERLRSVAEDERLSHTPLIHVTTVSEDWQAWFEAAGAVPATSLGGLRFDTIQLAMQAAAQGFGIALGRKPLIDEDLEQGRLVEIAGPPRPGSTCYWLVGAERTFERLEAKLFRRWLVEELQGIGEPAGPDCGEPAAQLA